MANVDAAYGFRPHGIPKDCHPHEYDLLSTNSAIRIGDPVKITTAGYIDIAAEDDGADIIGISAQYRAANAGGTTRTATILVWDDPRMEFEVQTESDTNMTQALIGDCCNHNVAAGSDIYSGHELALDSAVGDGLTANWKIIGIVKRPDNALGEHCDVIVQFGEIFRAPSAAGVAV